MTGFVSIHPSAILWLSVLFYLSPEIVFPFLLAAAVHELAHIGVLFLLKKPPDHLTVGFTGARLDAPSLSYREEQLAAAAGPLGSLLLGLLLPCAPTIGLYSLILGLINLLPLRGLDGWRILKAGLLLRFSPHKAQRLLLLSSLIVSVLLFFFSVFAARRFCLGLWPPLLSVTFLLRTVFLHTD